MRLLLIHTAGGESFVALTEDGRVSMNRVLPGRASSESLLPAIRKLFAGTGDDPLGSLDGVGVVHGPGSFTGARVGLSAAKGLCEAGALPLVAVSRLRLLASAAASETVLALLDAGRGEVFAGLYRAGVRVSEELLPGARVRGRFGAEIDEAAEIADTAAIACEPALVERLAPWVQLVPEPRAEGLVRLIEQRFRSGQVDDVATIDANYVRRTDAELLQRTQAAAR